MELKDLELMPLGVLQRIAVLSVRELPHLELVSMEGHAAVHLMDRVAEAAEAAAMSLKSAWRAVPRPYLLDGVKVVAGGGHLLDRASGGGGMRLGTGRQRRRSPHGLGGGGGGGVAATS